MYIWNDETNKLFDEVKEWLIPGGVKSDAPEYIKKKADLLDKLLAEEENRQIEAMFG